MSESQVTLTTLPLGIYIGANRYHTDDEEVLHLWNAAGESFDIRWPREGFEHPASRIARILAPYGEPE